MKSLFVRLISCGYCLMAAIPCWAQAPGEEAVAEKSYVFPYAIFGLGVALGLVAICRPGKRLSEIRRPEGS